MFSLLGKGNEKLELISKITTIKGSFRRTLLKYLDMKRDEKLAIVMDWTMYQMLSPKFKKAYNIIIYSTEKDWNEDVWQTSSISWFSSVHSKVFDRFLLVGGSDFITKFCNNMENYSAPRVAFSEVIIVAGSKPSKKSGWPVLDSGDTYFKDVGFMDDENVHCFVT